MVFAAAAGVICRGPDREVEGELTYVLLNDWLTCVKEQRPVEPEVELARRYFVSFGPAGVEDFAAWSGLALPAARAACSALGLPARRSAWSLWIVTAAGFSWRESAGRVQAGGFCLGSTPTWSATATARCCAMQPRRERSTPVAGSIPASSMTGAWSAAGGCTASPVRAPSRSGCSSPLRRQAMRRLWQQRQVTSVGFWALRLDWSCGETRH